MPYEVAPPIGRVLWPELIRKFPTGPEHPHVKKTKNQKVSRACNCFTVASALEFTRSVARLPDEELDAFEMYERLMEADGGTHMGEVIREAQDEAFKPLGRILKVRYCPTFDHQMSEVLRGFAITSYMAFYPNYNKPDPTTGWLPAPKGTPESHGMMGFKPAFRPDGSGNYEFGIWHLQSYGLTWSPATKNCCILSEKQLTQPVGSGGAFAIITVHDEGYTD